MVHKRVLLSCLVPYHLSVQHLSSAPKWPRNEGQRVSWSMQVARAMLLEDPNTVSSVESYVMQVLVQLDLDGCILVRPFLGTGCLDQCGFMFGTTKDKYRLAGDNRQALCCGSQNSSLCWTTQGIDIGPCAGRRTVWPGHGAADATTQPTAS
jgi:hypothetical protein